MNINLYASAAKQVERHSPNSVPRKHCHRRAVSYEDDQERDAKHARLDCNTRAKKDEEMTEAQETEILQNLIDANNELRNQVQILRSVPDMIVAFDLDGNIQYTNYGNNKLESFWEMTTPNTKGLIEMGITNALAQEPEANRSWPLFSGRAMQLHILFMNEQGQPKLQLISLKGTIYHNDDSSLECVVSIRSIVRTGMRHVVSFASVDTGSS